MQEITARQAYKLYSDYDGHSFEWFSKQLRITTESARHLSVYWALNDFRSFEEEYNKLMVQYHPDMEA